MWCIPPAQSAEFVAAMERVLDLYARPYDPCCPVVCMDEQPKQLIGQTRKPMVDSSGRVLEDHEYTRHGVCCVWMFNEPLGNWRDARVGPTRTAIDWAHQVRELVDHPRFGKAKRITLVCDNLNTHNEASFYKAFSPEEAKRILSKLDLQHTPKHGSWLNMAECELSVLSRQCIGGRMDQIEQIAEAARAWAEHRNQQKTGIDWQFTTQDARIKLKTLYPQIQE